MNIEILAFLLGAIIGLTIAVFFYKFCLVPFGSGI